MMLTAVPTEKVEVPFKDLEITKKLLRQALESPATTSDRNLSVLHIQDKVIATGESADDIQFGNGLIKTLQSAGIKNADLTIAKSISRGVLLTITKDDEAKLKSHLVGIAPNKTAPTQNSKQG